MSRVIAVRSTNDFLVISVRQQSRAVLAVREKTRRRVVLAGVRGPVGVPGSGAGETYSHTQATPADVWTVPHNLDRRPSVVVTDLSGNAVLSDFRYVDSNIIQITHGRPVAGYAYCN